MTKRLIIVGSPRAYGRSAHVTKSIVVRYQVQDPDDAIAVFSLAEHGVGPCTACNACIDGAPCVINDDMQDLYALIDQADDLTVVSPVFFAGPPAQYKAVLDRLQACFWHYIAGRRQGEGQRPSSQDGQGHEDGPGAGQRPETGKRPLHLFVVGEGGDPHGFEPLVVCTQSAFAVAGFRLDDVYNGVGLEGDVLDDLAFNPEIYRWRGPSRG